LQVESIFPTSARFAVLILCGSALLAPVTGCRRPPGPDVMATVNSKDILRSDLEKYYTASLAENPQQPSAEQAQIVRLNILKEMIDDEILQQRAAKLNLAASDEDVNAKYTEMKAPYTQEDFDKLLKQRNLSEADLKRDMRRSLTKTKLLNKEIESKINITDAEIAGYYAAHKAEFNLIEQRYGLARIMVTDAPGAQTSNLQVYNAIAKLKPGQITETLPVYDSAGPSRHTVGYAIYKLISREPAGQRELNDPRVQQAIHQLLHEGHAQLLKNAYDEMLHDEAKVHNYLADQILKEGGN